MGWRKDSCNFDHLKMELIDMLHFVLSDEIRRYKNIPTLVANYERDSKRPIELKAIGRFADVLAFNQYGFKVDSTNPKILPKVVLVHHRVLPHPSQKVHCIEKILNKKFQKLFLFLAKSLGTKKIFFL